MRPVESVLEAELRTTSIVNVVPRYAIGIPPSDIDPVWDEMRVDVGGRIIYRDFDPGEPIATGAPIPLVTMTGEPLVTMTGEELVTVVSS